MQARKPRDRAALRRLGDAIVRRRILGDLSQEHISDAAGLSVLYLRQMERGTANPSFLTLRRVAKALGATVEELVRDTR